MADNPYCRLCGSYIGYARSILSLCAWCVKEAADRPPVQSTYPAIRAPKRLPKGQKWPNKP